MSIALVLGAGPAAALEHRCGGVLSPQSECCCGHGESSEEADSPDEAESAPASRLQSSCCELKAPAPFGAPQSLSIAAAADAELSPPTRLATALPSAPPPRPLFASPAQSAHGPPLFAQNCRFLI